MLPKDYLKEGVVQLVKYTKSNGEVTERVIVPTHVPSDNVKAFDISGLSAPEIYDFKKLYDEYAEYVENRQKLIVSFESWLEQTQGPNHGIEVKYRTFKPDGLEPPDNPI